jgi:phosphotransferase system  glucose/maltose/N-acetylglucosamine-specific IIC component
LLMFSLHLCRTSHVHLRILFSASFATVPGGLHQCSYDRTHTSLISLWCVYLYSAFAYSAWYWFFIHRNVDCLTRAAAEIKVRACLFLHHS